MRKYKITHAAKADIQLVTSYTAKNFGERALERYLCLIETAILNLRVNPDRLGVKHFNKHIMKYHLSTCKNEAIVDGCAVKNPRHIIFFQLASDESLEILRILHDSMDFVNHLPDFKELTKQK